ncbi:MAG: archaeoflavoprotein AfpA [Hadesarchaea archaeon]|nr:archaeoflavoprotein AfpA [Hadesarchaea archaeon]
MPDRVAWGITGSGDRLREIVAEMRRLAGRYPEVEIRVFLSRAGEEVVRMYGLWEELEGTFGRLAVEKGPNQPFLAGALQRGSYRFLLIAPATSNTVAKIALGIGDSLLSNSALQALKVYPPVPVCVMPCDLQEGFTVTRLPSGEELRLRIRREDVENVERLRRMEGVEILRGPEELEPLFRKHLGPGGGR